MNCSLSPISAQQIKWMSWEEAVELNQVEPKKIFIDVYTNWCQWCKQMDESTFRDTNIIRYLNEYYYAVKLDAQQEGDIVFEEETYRLVTSKNTPYHEFALKLMNGRMKYPTVVFMDKELDVIQSIPGYRDPFELELFLIYFGEDKHLSQPWFRFKRDKEIFRQEGINSLQIPVNSRNW